MEELNNEYIQSQKKIIYRAIFSAIAVAAVFTLLQEKDIAKGILIGTCFSIINFVLLGKSISMTLMRSRSRASLIGFVSIVGRYIILAIPMVIAVKSASFNFVAVVVGIFAVQIVILLNYIVFQPIFNRE